LPTPAQVRRERKVVLRRVRADLSTLNTTLETTRRHVNRILKLKRQLPDDQDAMVITTNVRDLDKLLDKVAKTTLDFSKQVRIF